jgi:pyrimidine operon attenuation protein/uracil phosphoribosyltransferase
MAKKTVMTEKEINLSIKNISEQILKKNPDLKNLVLIGIVTRGVCLANRIAKEIEKKKNINLPVGSLDITFYRDDVDSIARQPLAKETKIPFDLTNKKIILVDDVLFTGRSIRAALDELIDFARPKSVQLAVLIDRGHRELPIQADFIGKTVKTNYQDQIQVQLKEVDGLDRVTYEVKK